MCRAALSFVTIDDLVTLFQNLSHRRNKPKGRRVDEKSWADKILTESDRASKVSR
jgi:hypothetical protein